MTLQRRPASRSETSTSPPCRCIPSYQIDGKLLRAGAANFSAFGFKRQDNDLVVIESAQAAAAFNHNFGSPFAWRPRLKADSLIAGRH
jgi:hypothetical protein